MEEFNAIYYIFPLVLSQQADCKPFKQKTKSKSNQISMPDVLVWAGQIIAKFKVFK